MMHRKSLTIFLSIAFGLAWILFLLPLAFGSAGAANHRAATTAAWAIAMWAPGVGAILATRFGDQQKISALNLLRLGEKRAYVWAWLLPPALVAAAGTLTWALGIGKLDLEFKMIRAAMAQAAGPQIPPEIIIALQILVAFTIGPLFNTLFALGEELGWRGYLLPKLLPLGQLRAIVLSGLIWGLWHTPAIMQGHNYPGQPVLGVFLMMGFCILFGAILSWLYLRTRSPWAPALGHGTLNAVAGFPLLFMPEVNMSVGGMLTSLIGWIPMLLFIGWLLWSKRLPVNLSEGETAPVVTEQALDQPADHPGTTSV